MFLLEDLLTRVSTRRQWGSAGIQHLLRTSRFLLVEATARFAKRCWGEGNGGLAAPTSSHFMLDIQQEVISLIGSLKLQVHVLILHSKDAFFLDKLKTEPPLKV